jgi:hypothetical protein
MVDAVDAERGVSLVLDRHFVLATRDTGYRTPAAALAELVDNALQADATDVQLFVAKADDESDVSVAILDNGIGMNSSVLQTALQFGGSTRFNDRSGPGRYGMGLPNSSVSYARRVDVYSWRDLSRVIHSYLDVDRIANGVRHGIPAPRAAALPGWVSPKAARSGTLVVWSRCDRLEARRISTVVRHITQPFGRMFRYFLWRGIKLTVNEEAIRPIDPLFLSRQDGRGCAVPYGKPLTYRLVLPNDRSRTGLVRVRFVELPVSIWHDLPIDDKRRAGIVKGAGVSVVRAEREVAYGWYFMGRKRRENYDDWWRCEVSFDPRLDEYFGLTHSKQAINPRADLQAILVPDMEAAAHALNARVRRAFSRIRGTARSFAVRLAERRESQFARLRPAPSNGTSRSLLRSTEGLRYQLDVEALEDDSFYTARLVAGRLRIILNREHPFFEKLYHPLTNQVPSVLRSRLQCFLFALARAEVDAPDRVQRYWYRRKRLKWSNVLSAFLGT